MLQQPELIPNPSNPAAVEVAGADLAQAVAGLEADGRTVEAVTRVGQSRYRLQHRRGWVASTRSRCPASTAAENERRLDGTFPSPTLNPLGTASEIPKDPMAASSVN